MSQTFYLTFFAINVGAVSYSPFPLLNALTALACATAGLVAHRRSRNKVSQCL